MKKEKRNQHLTVYQSRQPMYPNAADTNYVTRKLLDIATAIVSTMGLITAMIFLIALT
jgi:hypothetical protein